MTHLKHFVRNDPVHALVSTWREGQGAQVKPKVENLLSWKEMTQVGFYVECLVNLLVWWALDNLIEEGVACVANLEQ